mmetsp:Transcript_20695/g.33015  ORF Transcript_20695/g.33015 Transcript_20695/m.33015 type:complete len:111 (+) Transcript_20695:269-601(+)
MQWRAAKAGPKTQSAQNLEMTAKVPQKRSVIQAQNQSSCTCKNRLPLSSCSAPVMRELVTDGKKSYKMFKLLNRFKLFNREFTLDVPQADKMGKPWLRWWSLRKNALWPN